MSKTTIHQTNLSMTTVPSLPKWQNFVFSSSAPMLAVLFTNPFDTAKVRLQLQGQMQAGQKIYRNSLDALWKIGRNEGLRGLQQGEVFLVKKITLFHIYSSDIVIVVTFPCRTYSSSFS
jgi:solute carrier family 25 protein 34/35